MESLDYYDPLSDNHVNYSADDHQGSDRTILSVIEGEGRRTGDSFRLHQIVDRYSGLK